MYKKYDKIITHQPRILNILLEQCLLEERIEVQVDKRPQIFFSHFMDETLEKKHTLDKNGRFVIVEHPYELFSYLKKEQYLLLKPLVPDEGNMLIVDGDNIRIMIRFFFGNNALVADLSFERFVKIGDEAAIRASYPLELGIVHTRMNLRTQALPDSKVTVIINTARISNFKTHIQDISLGGLSFCSIHPPDLLPTNDAVNMILSFPGMENLTIDGIIRHYIRMPKKCDCGIGEAICGVMFENVSMDRKMQVNELIAFIQKEYLIKEKEELIRFNLELERKVKEKTEELRQKDLQLIEMDRIAGIGTLAAGIAHEINNPLGFVKSSIGSLKKGMDKVLGALSYWDDKPVSEPLLKDYEDYLAQINFEHLTDSLDTKFDRIQRGIERIMKIVNSLRSFSRLDMEAIGKIDINQSIEDAVEILSTQDAKDVEFVREFQKVPVMKCSPKEINQCLLHILKNALDAVENKGTIKIFTSYNEKEDQIIIRIADNGKGMSPEVVRQALNPFFTTKSVGSGTGIGLSLTERIIKRHGGMINISSKEGEGTAVMITLAVIGKVTKYQHKGR
jgi:signal transduction histidine kinase